MKDCVEMLVSAVDAALNQIDPRSMDSQTVTEWGNLTMIRSSLLRLAQMIDRGTVKNPQNVEGGENK